MSKVVVLVDLQNDFIDGALGTPEAQAIIPKVVEKIKEYQSEGARFIVTRDTHDVDYLSTQEGQNLPVEHCIIGTTGWNVSDEIQNALSDARANLATINKMTFGDSNLAEYIGDEVSEVVLMGLCTDICVISNAVILKAGLLKTRVSVVADCCAGVTPESHDRALEVMRGLQINII